MKYTLFANIKKLCEKKNENSFPELKKNLQKQLDLVNLKLKNLNDENLSEISFNLKKQPLESRKKLFEDILDAIRTSNAVHNLTSDQKELLVLLKNPHIVGFRISNISIKEQNKLDHILPAAKKELIEIFKY